RSGAGRGYRGTGRHRHRRRRARGGPAGGPRPRPRRGRSGASGAGRTPARVRLACRWAGRTANPVTTEGARPRADLMVSKIVGASAAARGDQLSTSWAGFDHDGAGVADIDRAAEPDVAAGLEAR